MSKSVERVSEKAPAEPQSDSVYDFFYCDTQRLGSFLAQFDDAGHLQEVIQRESVTKGARRGFKLNLGGGATVMGTGGTGTVGIERGPGDEGGESSERVYSPLWVNALTFLDYLESKNLLKRTIEDANVGNFVLFSGEMVLVDLSMLKQAWDNPTIKASIKDGMGGAQTPPANRSERRRADRKDGFGAGADAIFAMLSIMPHTIQCRMFAGSGTNCWFTLEAGNIVGKASDVLLKHGSHIQGTWNVVGILDALPSHINAISEDGTPLVEVLAGLYESQVGQLAVRLGPVARELVGRPEGAFGLTPLLIFREISG